MTKFVKSECDFCECGCKKRVRLPGQRFIHNHHIKYLKTYENGAKYLRSLKGKTWEEVHGKKKAKKMKKAMSKVHKGKKTSPELSALWSSHRKSSGNPFYGKSHLDETKEVIRKAQVETHLTDEHKERVSEGLAKAYAEGRRSVNRNKHYQGEFYSQKNGEYVSYRSSYELYAYQILEQLSKVAFYEVEPFAIKYSIDGKKRHYIPDILVTYTDDSQELMEVKPRNFINAKMNKAKFKAAKKFCKNEDIDFSILTSKHGSTDISKVGMCKIPIHKMEG